MNNSENNNKELEIRDLFKNKNTITLDEIKAFFQKQDPTISLSAIKRQINKQIKQGAISRIERGVYIQGKPIVFEPVIDKQLTALAKKIGKEFPELKFCVWNTSWILQFMTHQPFQHQIIIETESDNEQRTLYSESVFRFVQTHYKNVFHKPDNETIQNYISENKESIIIRPLVSEAPIQQLHKITIPMLEKILVDIYCDEALFSAQQGNEKATIYKEAFRKYTINTSKLLRYAARRTKRKEIEHYLKSLNIKF